MKEETNGLSKLGSSTKYNFDSPGSHILEAFDNRYPQRDYVITFIHPEFTSLCPMTGQPDFATITLRYVPDSKCVESKSFKLYMAAFRNYGAFMESITNKIADDLIEVLKPRCLEIYAEFNIRGGTAIKVRVNYVNPALSGEKRQELAGLW